MRKGHAGEAEGRRRRRRRRSVDVRERCASQQQQQRNDCYRQKKGMRADATDKQLFCTAAAAS
jgi:hypothetical protein